MSMTGAEAMARLVFLGRLEDRAGCAEMDVAPGPLSEILTRLDPALALDLLGERVRMALNGALVPEAGALVLAQGDELAFLPPSAAVRARPAGLRGRALRPL
jgi:molybdopterin synthase sulfur carrier subunit